MRCCLNRILYVLITCSILLFMSCCSESPLIIEKPGPDYSHEINQLRLVVEKLGLSESQASQMNLNELVTEIKVKMNDYVYYSGESLSDADNKRIELIMFGETHLIKIVNDYNQFIQNIKGKKIIVLPEE